jgi:hypothetical protein
MSNAKDSVDLGTKVLGMDAAHIKQVVMAKGGDYGISYGMKITKFLFI